MIVAGLVLAALAAVLHVFIFYLESVVWTGPRARKVFGTSPQQAEATRVLAFNQGFYNLFLAISVFLGAGLYSAGQPVIGLTLVLVGVVSMAAAAAVLLVSGANAAAAVKQGALPLMAVVLIVVGVV